MRKIRISHITTVMLLASLALVSCVREELRERSTYEGELVDVSLDLGIAPLVEMSEALTKGPAINNSTNHENDTIKNLWILQFNGTGNDATRVGNPIYLPTYSDGAEVKLVASEDDNRILFIANTFDPSISFNDVTTFADAMKKRKIVSRERDVVYVDSTSVSGQKSHYPMMNGYTDTKVVAKSSISATIKHNVARVDVQIVQKVSDIVMIESVTLRSVQNRINYVTNYSGSAPGSFPYDSSNGTINYSPTMWEDGEEVVSGFPTRNFSFYLPANESGTTASDTEDGKYKGVFAPDNASYVFIVANYLNKTGGSTADTAKVTYSFYLGENLINNYNISPNGHYSYTFTISGKGNESKDGRVEDLKTVDFRTDSTANSYIINPPSVGTRLYRVPIRRVVEFWEGTKYENNNTILTELEKGWQVEVIWSDFGHSGSLEFTLGSKSIDVNLAEDYFEFSVKEGTFGNCVVGIKPLSAPKTGAAEYLWSWHLWITDYKPDMTPHPASVDATTDNVYYVKGGNVHAYYNNTFFNGEYKGKVMMDRNLGARDIYYHSNKDGCLYYQFGRKDPFPGERPVYIRQDNGTYVKEPWNKLNAHVIAYNGTGNAYSENVPYSVLHPLIFIKSVDPSKPDDDVLYWTLGKYCDNKNSYVWQDPNVAAAGKSIFDPCPPGWKVPKIQAWSDFDSPGSFTLNVPLSEGRNYVTPNKDTGIFYPFVRFMESSSGQFPSPDKSCGVYWTCMNNPLNTQYNAICGVSDSSIVAAVYNIPSSLSPYYLEKTASRATGCPVRCVQE